MNYLSSWDVYTGSIDQWLKKLLELGDIGLNSTVWGGADGSYSVGDDYDPEEFEVDTDYTDRGTVEDWFQS